jgi:SulP family sulfate permease
MLATKDALAGYDEATMLGALFTLTFLIGLIQLLLGVFKLGRFTKFISNSVMIGFLTGVAVLVILSQLQDLTGYSSSANRTITKALDVVLHPGAWNWPSVAVGLATIALMILFSRTRLENLSAALAMVAGTVLAILLNLETVAVVGDTTSVRGAIPLPALPHLALMPNLLLSAFALALIGLIQASGVSQTVPNPDGEFGDASRDFSAQGIANIVSGLFRGLPLGGSLGGTGIVLGTGAKSRWANVFVTLGQCFCRAVRGCFCTAVRRPGGERGHARDRRRVDRHRRSNHQSRRGGRCMGHRQVEADYHGRDLSGDADPAGAAGHPRRRVHFFCRLRLQLVGRQRTA